MCVEPINFQTGAILLSTPTAAALYVENIHLENATALRCQNIYAAAARFSRM
jgi:hypothetical protein